jgi:hypothetical protein|tara:strand:+ start:50 stop:280 length:231 start_codon:yes stop_codon:yes gene_type:complete
MKGQFKKSRVMNALYAKAIADKEKALMALDLLENQAVGIGDHTANDFFDDAEKALQLLIDAEDKIECLKRHFSIEV